MQDHPNMDKNLLRKVNAGEALTWEDLNKAKWAVRDVTSSAGYNLSYNVVNGQLRR